MQTIVTPTNFSAASLNAVNYAADMACVIGANLSLLNVVPYRYLLAMCLPLHTALHS
jgi:nucleotide-binding universal stress UspA family protein